MPDPYSYLIKTYRYLRLAMIVVILMLGVSVVYEWWKTNPRCYLSSISAYYYTPVQAILIGALISVGVCMVALRGSTTAEDVLLNLGGMVAPVVALVPTPNIGDCRSVPMTLTTGDASANIDNNMKALFAAGAIALVIAAVLMVMEARGTASPQVAGQGSATARQAVTDASRRTTGVYWLGLVAAALILGLGLWWFLANRTGFIRAGHYTAAAILLACIVLVVLLNSYDNRRRRATDADWARNRAVTPAYLVIATLMILSAGIPYAVYRLRGWDHWLMWTEILLTVLFGLFWIIQTAELWKEGIRGGIKADGSDDSRAAPEPGETAARPVAEHAG